MQRNRPFGQRVLRVRLSWDAETRIALAAESAVRALHASGIRAVLDEVPRDFAPDLVNIEWTDEPEESRFVKLWAGHEFKDPAALRMAEAFACAFHGARRSWQAPSG